MALSDLGSRISYLGDEGRGGEREREREREGVLRRWNCIRVGIVVQKGVAVLGHPLVVGRGGCLGLEGPMQRYGRRACRSPRARGRARPTYPVKVQVASLPGRRVVYLVCASVGRTMSTLLERALCWGTASE
jgi:hypothetical protein